MPANLKHRYSNIDPINQIEQRFGLATRSARRNSRTMMQNGIHTIQKTGVGDQRQQMQTGVKGI
jgi:hypothetical protein